MKLHSSIITIIQPINYFMRSLLYLIAVILIIGWILGFFVYSAGGLIHILLVIAIIALLLGVIRRA
ncbi:MAG TPA: lmo0937 family membrane protein [Puia sp.]|nr:lmo0937 family membrane protein [Puia sp.]